MCKKTLRATVAAPPGLELLPTGESTQTGQFVVLLTAEARPHPTLVP
jgi:hypothetical protein